MSAAEDNKGEAHTGGSVPLHEGSMSLLAGVPDGMQAMVVADVAEDVRKRNPDSPVAAVFVARDGGRMQKLAAVLEQMLPGHPVLIFPAWDCLPYDRVSPSMVTVTARMATLARLCSADMKGAIIVTAANALVQRILPRNQVAEMVFHARPGQVVDSEKLVAWAGMNGYLRVPTVREAGEFSVRGGLIDLFPPGSKRPLRFDFFGSVLETIRSFDAQSQRTRANLSEALLVPVSEIVLHEKTIRRFRQNYTSDFGGNTVDDPLYGAISAGQRYAGAEHWLPYFYDELALLGDYCGGAAFVFDEQCTDAIKERRLQILDYYQARKDARALSSRGEDAGAPYNPIAPERLYDLQTPAYEMAETGLSAREWVFQISAFGAVRSDADGSLPAPVGMPSHGPGRAGKDFGGHLPRNFAAERRSGDINLFAAVATYLDNVRAAGKRCVLTCWSEGTRDRMLQVLVDHGLKNHRLAANWHDAVTGAVASVALVVLGLEHGFETSDLVVLSEQDILGDRQTGGQRRKRAENALTEVSILSEGDLVVHVDHGIGRFVGLKAIEAAGAPHDCVEIEYARGDRLYLPVENIELLSRYGEASSTALLDRLGGAAWQAKKAQLKQRIRVMAEQLIRIAANRALSRAEPIDVPMGAYDEFAARFQFEETEDQLNAIGAVMEDLSSGQVMDRLVCGDVGFGKTEVALRAAFCVAMSGRQVAVVVPTTLLARQHFNTFRERFAGLPVNVVQMSRLVGSSEMKRNREGLANGSVDIVVGTHALLAKSIRFRDLGLLVVDEEQHFGVAHKERLKELKGAVHVLTLTATPIPRTLQMALTGVRDLSLLATPPVDRLAIRTFISPFDGLTIREALLREKYRGGQAFYVVPRIKDQGRIATFLSEQVPEISFVVANGRMGSGELDDIMNAFYDGKFDVLLATTIVESGLDIPNANTLIVHRADMFGLAQLYQIRGRIGRSNVRAYALFTVPANVRLTDQAQRRLEVLQSLESLGAGFQLASHDMDIRGAGNLLGDEQSGHIREVGYELYQSMLEEAVASLKSGEGESEGDGEWSPQISVGLPVMIPEHYVPDLQVRLQLYRRLGELDDNREIDAFGAEMIDRFGPLPEEVESLLKIVMVKSLCRKANVEKIDAGPKGAVVTLRNNSFPNPEGLVRLISDPAMGVRLKPDHKLVFSRNWPSVDHRLKGVASVMLRLARLAG